MHVRISFRFLKKLKLDLEIDLIFWGDSYKNSYGIMTLCYSYGIVTFDSLCFSNFKGYKNICSKNIL